MKCQKKRCLKETNPKYHPGVFIGKPFEYEDNALACHLCMEEVQEENPKPKKILIVGSGQEMEFRHKLIKRLSELPEPEKEEQ